MALFALLGSASASVEEKNRPVSKVINLLKDMQVQLAKEQEEDEAIYNKMACWCETNDKEKTKAIADAEEKINQLTATIEELTALSAQLNTEIEHLNKEIERNQSALAKATALRQKQLAEFNAEEKDLLQSISALKSAVTVLSKHHSEEALLHIGSMLRHQMSKHSDMLDGIITDDQRKTIGAFLQTEQPMNAGSYAPQSGEIFGILRNMKDTFESNLAQTQKDEMSNQKSYEDVKAAKEAEIAAGQEQVEEKTQHLATTDENNANAKQDLEDTRNTLSADQKFLMDLKEKCQQTDAEWEERQKTRQEEIQAVSEALALLSSDDAHDLFTKTFNFVQVAASKTGEDARRARAANMLADAAHKLNSPQLSEMATAVRLDAFTRVKKAIDDMIAALLQEKADEIKHKDFCVAELNTNERQTELKDRTKNELLAKIDELTAAIETLANEIATLKNEIAEMQVQLKRAGEDREKANAEFQVTVADQRATQKLLSQALNVLKGFFDKKAKSFVQQPAGPPPPPSFNKYEKNSGSGGVMTMIQQIINDAKRMEAEAIKGEEDSQAAYESFVKETNNSIEAKNKSIVNKSEEKAGKEGDKTQAESDLADTMTELEELANYNAQLHSSCDFTMKNFDIRQTGRDQEVEALRQAKAILSGANSFLQRN